MLESLVNCMAWFVLMKHSLCCVVLCLLVFVWRTEQLYQNVMSLWHQLHMNMKSVVSWHYLQKDISNISSWSLDTVSIFNCDSVVMLTFLRTFRGCHQTLSISVWFVLDAPPVSVWKTAGSGSPGCPPSWFPGGQPRECLVYGGREARARAACSELPRALPSTTDLLGDG